MIDNNFKDHLIQVIEDSEIDELTINNEPGGGLYIEISLTPPDVDPVEPIDIFDIDDSQCGCGLCETIDDTDFDFNKVDINKDSDEEEL